jgi:DNA-binding CsgD family transcriptional regulator
VVVGSWPLIGRREELARVAELRRHGKSAGVVVAGAPGVGKTRFAREATLAAERERWTSQWATATRAAASIPFGAFAHLLPVPGPGAGRRLQLLQHAAGSLRDQAGGRRLVVAVDDAHLLDDGSAALVHQLASTGAAFVVVTIRSGERVRDPLLALWKDGLTEYLELQPLAEAEVRQLLARALAGDLDGATLLRLWEVTRGNALFLRELVVDGLERGALAAEGGLWRWTGSMEPGARVAEIVRARIGKLTIAERDALELVAFAEPIGVSLVERLIPKEGIERLERRGLLTFERSERRVDARLVHPLFAEVLRSRGFPWRSLAARLAGALAATGARRREDLLRLATWQLEGGGSGSPELLAAAAWRAWASSDPVLAERLAIAAIDRGSGFEARYALALALRSQERFREADAVLAHLAPEARDRDEQLRAADASAAGLWGIGMADQAERMLLGAEAQAGDHDTRDELAAIRAMVLAFSGHAAASLEVARPLLARPAVGRRARVRAGLAAVISLWLTGGAEEARAVVGEVRELILQLAEELPFLGNQVLAAFTVGQALAGRLREADEEAARGYERALTERAHEPLALWAMVLGRVALGEGSVVQARLLLQEAAARFAEADATGLGALCLASLSSACAQGGDRAGAEQALGRAEAALRPGVRMGDGELGLARVWRAVAGGDLVAARAQALSVAASAQASGHHAYQALALHQIARLGDAASVADPLRLLTGTVDGPLIEAYVAHVDALAAGDATALDRAGISFAAIGANLLAAEAFAEASAAYRAQGRIASSRRSGARATALIERCGMPVTPALANIGDAPTLTRREREVASLAAGGLSNRAIAERLVVSVRTVEHHLEHVYQKLGVNHRGELAALLAPIPRRE